MPITRRPTKSAARDEQKIDDIINKGGSAPRQQKTTAAGRKSASKKILVRVPVKLLDRIEKELESRAVETPRNTWILEAITEKLGKRG